MSSDPAILVGLGWVPTASISICAEVTFWNCRRPWSICVGRLEMSELPLCKCLSVILSSGYKYPTSLIPWWGYILIVLHHFTVCPLDELWSLSVLLSCFFFQVSLLHSPITLPFTSQRHPCVKILASGLLLGRPNKHRERGRGKEGKKERGMERRK